MIGPENSRPFLPEPIKSKTKTVCNLVTRVFSRFMLFACLFLSDFFPCFDCFVSQQLNFVQISNPIVSEKRVILRPTYSPSRVHKRRSTLLWSHRSCWQRKKVVHLCSIGYQMCCNRWGFHLCTLLVHVEYLQSPL